MLSWLFKKRGPAAPAAPAATPIAAQTAAARAEVRTETRARQVDQARAEWGPRLSQAQGDDAALLQVALSAPLPDIRLAAVEAMVGEDGLRQAERELRSRDRRAHSSAKRRLEAVVGQREAGARAQTLIATAHALSLQAQVPVNHLVALDRNWQGLEAAGLAPAQHTQFAALRQQIDQSMQAHDRQLQALQRWTADAQRVLAALQAGSAQAAAGGSASDVSADCVAAQALREACPEGAASAKLDQALALALQTASAVAARRDWLVAANDADAAPAADLPPAEADDADDAEVSAPPPPHKADTWHALPPLPDAALARLLDQQFEQWLHQQGSAALAAAPAAEPPKAMKMPARHARARRPNADEQAQLATLLDHAETSLAEGQLGGVQLQLSAFDALLETSGAVLPAGDALLVRLQAVLAERARLKDWQQWGGGQARESLVAEAEALARLTLASDPALPDAPALALKPHGDAIQALRNRWRELDRLGAAAPQALWQRFDAALQTAYQPVAAKQALLKAARQDNLAAREALLAVLDALPDPGTEAPSGSTSDAPSEATPDDPAAPWKEPMRALDRFHTAWRQLGPIEHTVPAAARDGLQQHLRRSLDRIEQPMLQARQAAEAVREQMIAHAESLLAGPDQLPPPDAVQQARALQFDWQQHARSLPLARGVENALWTRFKTAIDAVYGQREAAFRARDAELEGRLAEREALLQRLLALAEDSAPAAERERSLADIDRAWRQPVDLPRGAADRLESRFREARASVAQRSAAIAHQQWQAQCAALAARIGLCEQREQAGSADADAGLAAQWVDSPDSPALPGAWGSALAQRWAGPVTPGPLPEPETDALLLLLEAALDLPATPEQQAARQQIKLLAMKDKFEGRASSRPAPLAHADALAALLRQRGATQAQRGRLLALVAALGRAPAGALGSPVARA